MRKMTVVGFCLDVLSVHLIIKHYPYILAWAENQCRCHVYSISELKQYRLSMRSWYLLSSKPNTIEANMQETRLTHPELSCLLESLSVLDLEDHLEIM